tara:strand:+ start:516 stop:935 length:420 start_codon:yes stop_codon:yes gene_type:complete
MSNKTSGLPKGKMKPNDKNVAIRHLFNERDKINREYQIYKFNARNVNEKLRNKNNQLHNKNNQLHNKINQLHNINIGLQEQINQLLNQNKYLKETQDKNNNVFVKELLSFYCSDIKTCNCSDEQCEHRVNLLTYLNTPD